MTKDKKDEVKEEILVDTNENTLDEWEDDLEEVKKPKKHKKEEIDIDDEDEFDTILDDEDEDYKENSLASKISGIETKLNILTILVVIVLLFSLVNTIVGISGGNSNNNNNNTGSNSDDDSGYSYDTSSFKEITANDIQSESKSGTIILWIGRQGCSACVDYAPKIASMAKEYNTEVKYLDLSKIVDFTVEQPYIKDTTAWNKLKELTGSGEWKTFVADNMNSTPLTIVVNKNKVIGGRVGSSADTSDIEKIFKDAGFSK